MKRIVFVVLVLITVISFAQKKQNKEALLALKKANNHVFKGNSLVNKDDFVSGEMAYRKAISEQSNTITGAYNLGNAYYKKGNYEEALFRHKQASKNAKTKSERHKAYHNMGNAFMQSQNYSEAVEAYKNALRNNPKDKETRYNLAVAKKKQKEKDDKEQKENKDKKDDKDKKDNKKDEKKNKEEDKKKDDKGDKEKENDKDSKDEDKKDDKKDDKKKSEEDKDSKEKEGDKEKEKQQPKVKPGQMSPQQIKSILEAMNNQEQKVQEKINAEKQKGVKIKSEKDW